MQQTVRGGIKPGKDAIFVRGVPALPTELPWPLSQTSFAKDSSKQEKESGRLLQQGPFLL